MCPSRAANGVAALSTGVDAVRAGKQAYAIVYRNLLGQAATLAYMDTYLILAAAAAIMFALSFALKKNDPGGRPVRLE